ncbi:hypothetical protein Q31b_24780 [Novipirellula aureliae]|uniref:Uncharacterized protein n=2 Tax=Novipirellula aureliae TaxID=2527966 RepID=A0A5C6E3H6_9BACT|nr:hypothetical protein Q31b_24780 [Novipirellula aureliae]
MVKVGMGAEPVARPKQDIASKLEKLRSMQDPNIHFPVMLILDIQNACTSLDRTRFAPTAWRERALYTVGFGSATRLRKVRSATMEWEVFFWCLRSNGHRVSKEIAAWFVLRWLDHQSEVEYGFGQSVHFIAQCPGALPQATMK